ncbi:PIN domain-containing protein [Kocuria sp. M4R2S49]|uniref:PIN domain-containing protein n=1 Tax=Kocuria rhizosphaericola TaxID=3376284 RepID=UPI003796D69E
MDTNILIALLDPKQETSDLSGFSGLTISSLSLSEMHMGVAAMASDRTKKALRENELARTRATFGAGIPYDDRCALAFGVVVEEAVRNGASHRRNVIARMIAATAMVHGLTQVTRNTDDFKHLSGLVEVEKR